MSSKTESTGQKGRGEVIETRADAERVIREIEIERGGDGTVGTSMIVSAELLAKLLEDQANAFSKYALAPADQAVVVSSLALALIEVAGNMTGGAAVRKIVEGIMAGIGHSILVMAQPFASKEFQDRVRTAGLSDKELN